MANQVELNANANMVIELLNSVPIEVDYKHDIFIRETKNFQQYVTTSMKATKYIAGKKLNPAYDKLLKAKMQITPTQIKLDIINNKGEEKLKELEESYIDNRTKLALSANDDLDNSLINALSDSFMFFFSGDKKSYISILSNKDIYPKCLKKIDRTLCLVYTEDYNNLVKTTIKEYNKTNKTVSEASKGFQAKKLREKLTRTLAKEYTVPNLDGLLDTIARVSICYCIGTTDYKNIDQAALGTALKLKKSKTSSKDKTLPLFIRKMISMVCYSLLNLGNTASIKETGKQVDTNTGVTAQIMRDLHSRCEALGYPFFTKENKVFQFDKWSISPEEMLRRRSYIAPKMPITYAGMKQGWLGYMLADLQSQVVYERFLDGFGGSGASSVQFRHNTDAEYFVSDYHYANVCFYKILNGTNKEYKEFLDCLMLIQKCVKMGVSEREISEEKANSKEEKDSTAKKFNISIGAFYDIYDSVSDVCQCKIEPSDTKQEKIEKEKRLNACMFNVKTKFLSAVQVFDKSFTACTYSADTIIAAVFTAFGNMTVNGGIAKNVWKNTSSLETKTRADFKKLFDNVKSLYKSTKIPEDLGADTIALLKDSRFNNHTTLAYLDSPYIGTAEYNASEDSTDKKYDKGTEILAENTGKEFISSDFPMDTYLDTLENYEGKYIFSCRLNMPSPEPQAVMTSTFKAEKGSGLTVDKVHNHFSNYVWFFKRWLSMKDIDKYFVYCMIDTDWTLFEQAGSMYFNDKSNPAHYRPINEDFKKKFIQSDWGMPLEEDFKEKVYDYLRAIILLGRNYEIMITNYNADAPNFDSMYEYMFNIYGKQNEPTVKKTQKDSKTVKAKGNWEIMIPEHGKFIKIPMKLVAELVLTEFGNIKRCFTIK